MATRYPVNIVRGDWLLVLSGVTVNDDPATPSSPTSSLCQYCGVYAPGGTPLGGAFTLTHADADAYEAFRVAAGFPPTSLPAACRWAYFENPATTMIMGDPSSAVFDPVTGTFSPPLVPDPDAYFAITLYQSAAGLFLDVVLATISPGGCYPVFIFSGEVVAPTVCDTIAGASCSNVYTACLYRPGTDASNMGKNGTATLTRCA